MIPFAFARKMQSIYWRNIAQMVERCILNAEGAGSNPAVSLLLLSNLKGDQNEETN